MYRVFFAIQLLHSYFADGQARGLRLAPTPACGKLLSRHRMRFRQVGNTAYVLAHAEAGGQPLVPPDPDVVFAFHLLIDSPSLLERTVLPFEFSSPDRLYLSSLANNTLNTDIYLSRAVPAFDVTNNYVPGDLVTNGNDLAESIRSLAADPGNVVTDPGHWAPRGPVRAPTPADVLPFGTGDELFELPVSATQTIVKAFELNRTSGLYDVLVLDKTTDLPGAMTTVSLPLSTLEPGKYRVEVNGAEHFRYHDPAMAASGLVGVVEILSHLPPGNPYALLGAAGEIVGPVFSIRFLNPLVIWKYVARTPHVKAIKDSSGVYEFENPVPLLFQSKTPIPVTERPYDKISLDYKPPATAQTTYDKVANPSLANLKEVTVGGDTLPCAEIFLHY